MIVRALLWRSQDDYEISQVEVMKLHDLLGFECVLSRFCFSASIDLKRNRIDKIEHSLCIGPRMIKPGETNDNMVNHIEAILTGWSKKEDLLLGRNEGKMPNPWITAQMPFFCNVFMSSCLRTAVSAHHPDVLPILTMCASSMAAAFVGMSQHVVESELLAHFNSLVVQARRESIKNLYGYYS